MSGHSRAPPVENHHNGIIVETWPLGRTLITSSEGNLGIGIIRDSRQCTLYNKILKSDNFFWWALNVIVLYSFPSILWVGFLLVWVESDSKHKSIHNRFYYKKIKWNILPKLIFLNALSCFQFASQYFDKACMQPKNTEHMDFLYINFVLHRSIYILNKI